MDQGMLWYDNHRTQTVETRLQAAVDFFIAKYGHPPLCCFVNPDMLSKPIQIKGSIKVIPSERILKNHIWLEIGED
jgi:hypothetical protein